MPELPDVAVFERYIASTSLHKTIERVEVRELDLREAASPKKLRAALEGRRLVATRRHGKYLFIGIEGGGWLVLHFGMTGEPKYYKDPAETPEHARVIFHFENGYRLAYDCQRKLGTVSLTDDPEAFLDREEMGPDALDEGIDFNRFREMLAGRRGTVKGALMDQGLLSGIGNIYSDEILFHAHMHPKTPLADLDEKDLHRLYRAMHKVLEMAIERKADVSAFPRTWLLPNREDDCPRCGGEVKAIKVSGRTSHVCERCQPPP